MKTFINYPNNTEVQIETDIENNRVIVTTPERTVRFICQTSHIGGETRSPMKATKEMIHNAFMKCEIHEIEDVLRTLEVMLTQEMKIN